jgi:hypothetical protein
MTTTTTKKRTAKKSAVKRPAKKAAPRVASVAVDGITGEPVATAKPKRAKKAPTEPKAPAAATRVTSVHGTTTVHHSDEADLAIVQRVLPTLETVQANGNVVPYLLACSQGAMHLSIALPGQNLPYSDLPGLTLTVDPETLHVDLDGIHLGALDVDLIDIGGSALLESLRPLEGAEVNNLGWRKDWESHLAMVAGVVADARAQTLEATRH